MRRLSHIARLFAVALLLSGCCMTLEVGGKNRVISDSSSTIAPVVRRPRTAPKAKAPAAVQPAAKNVAIEAYIDYQCPYSRRVWPSLRRLQMQFKGRVQIRVVHNPLHFHDKAKPAAVAALAAAAQGKLFEMSDLLFLTPGNLAPERYPILAAQIGLDVARFKQDMGNPKLLARVVADQRAAKRRGAVATPTLFIGGRKIVGAKQPKTILAAVRAALR